MSIRFVNVDRDQPMLLPPDLRAWIPEDDKVAGQAPARVNHKHFLQKIEIPIDRVLAHTELSPEFGHRNFPA